MVSIAQAPTAISRILPMVVDLLSEPSTQWVFADYAWLEMTVIRLTRIAWRSFLRGTSNRRVFFIGEIAWITRHPLGRFRPILVNCSNYISRFSWSPDRT